MPLGILGNKIGMSQIFDKFDNVIPVTLIKTDTCIITQIKNISTDGYNAIQVGYKNCKQSSINKPQKGHLKNLDYNLKYLKEFKVKNIDSFKLHQEIDLTLFKEDIFVNIQANSSGKGFSGLQKRHNFKRGPMTHGSKNHRAPGSIGMGTSPGRVFPGKKMAGQLGNNLKTIKKVKIIKIDNEKNFLIVKGSIPGKPGNLVKITQIK